jgi:hypothetical protein
MEGMMNLLEHYIVKVHGEQEIYMFPDFVKVDLTYDCFGDIKRCLKMFRKSEWEEAKKKGVFLA